MEKKMYLLVTLALSVILLTFTNVAWAQTEKVIYSFTGGTDGGEPEGGVIVDAEGNLYGTTQSGGAGGAGTVFELTQQRWHLD